MQQISDKNDLYICNNYLFLSSIELTSEHFLTIKGPELIQNILKSLFMYSQK